MIYRIYCDESRQSSQRFMLLGGVIIDESNQQNVLNTIAHFREECKMHRELKWTKVSNSRLEEYKAFVDYFFALNNTDKIHFHTVIVDTHAVDHRRFSDGDAEDTFHKFYYQLLLNCFARNCCKHDQDARFLVYLDERKSRYSLKNLKRILNHGVAKKLQVYSEPFKTVEPRDSKQSDVLQLSDVILGSIGYHKNGFHLLADASPAKVELARYIAEKAGVKILGNNTTIGRVRFKMWNIQLK